MPKHHWLFDNPGLAQCRMLKAVMVSGLFLAFCVAGASLNGDETTGKSGGNPPESVARKKQREENLKEMKERAANAKVRIVSKEATSDAELVPRALFHYTDQPRHIADATLWGWVADGRLVAACKIEKYDHQNPATQWLYCFGSLAPGLVEAEWPSGHTFSAKKPGTELALIAAAPAPAAERPARLRQMKDIADHFSAVLIDATVGDTRQEMRRLPQPLYRYETPAGDMRDGAIFGFTTNGTNPDAMLVVELHQSGNASGKWKFSMAGMTTGGLSVKFDNKEVWSKPSVSGEVASFDTWEWFWERPK
jgi:hypothetical protein